MTDTRAEYDSLAGLYLPIAIAVVALVLVAIALAVVRGRRRLDADGAEGAPRREVAYAVGLAAIAAVLLVATFRTNDRVVSLAEEPSQRIEVTAFQWGWTFGYPDAGLEVTGDWREPPTLVVPTDRTVRFELTSRDVIHSFWIPALRFKRDAFPDRTSSFDLSFDRAGPQRMPGRCAEFCGLEHARMGFNVIALPVPEFARWLDDRAADPASRRSAEAP